MPAPGGRLSIIAEVPPSGHTRSKKSLRFGAYNSRIMSDNYDRSRAAECLERANRTNNRADKLAWLQLTECWLVLDQLLADGGILHTAPEPLSNGNAVHLSVPHAGT